MAMNNPQCCKSGLDLKKEGSGFFQQRLFADALECYTEGIRQSSKNDDELHITLL
jgi:hypothetical protein